MTYPNVSYCTCNSGGINPSCRQHGSLSYLLDKVTDLEKEVERWKLAEITWKGDNEGWRKISDDLRKENERLKRELKCAELDIETAEEILTKLRGEGK